MERTDLSVREHDFALILDNIDPYNDDVIDALYGACPDATLAYQRNVVTLDFGREALTLREAILSAVRDIYATGLGIRVVRVDDCEFVTQADIARRANVERATINNYINGKRGPGNFPAPSCHITDGHPLWQWCEVAYWLRRNDLVGDEMAIDARDVWIINTLLDFRNAQMAEPAEFAAVLETLTALDAAR